MAEAPETKQTADVDARDHAFLEVMPSCKPDEVSDIVAAFLVCAGQQKASVCARQWNSVF